VVQGQDQRVVAGAELEEAGAKGRPRGQVERAARLGG
jgi:hypothetical protein